MSDARLSVLGVCLGVIFLAALVALSRTFPHHAELPMCPEMRCEGDGQPVNRIVTCRCKGELR